MYVFVFFFEKNRKYVFVSYFIQKEVTFYTEKNEDIDNVNNNYHIMDDEGDEEDEEEHQVIEFANMTVHSHMIGNLSIKFKYLIMQLTVVELYYYIIL
jgi:hypothetical protein